MKKISLWYGCAALFTMIGSPVSADQNPSTVQSQPSNPATAPLPASQNPIASPKGSMPAPVAPAVTPVPTPAPAPANTSTQICMPPAQINDASVQAWAQKAALALFSFEPGLLEGQLNNLKTCFTEGGWKGFNTALQASGNRDAIINLKLSVISSLGQKTEIKSVGPNKWEVIVPVQVVYQNSTVQTSQLLDVKLLIGTVNDRLNIDQVIATPVLANGQKPVEPKPETKPAMDLKAPAAPTAPPAATPPAAPPAQAPAPVQ